MAEIRWTEEAVLWLEEIHKYISQDSVEVADRVIDEIFERVQVLKDFPRVGYKYEGLDDVRVLLYGHYRIAYLIKDDEEIDILGVFHGALDIEKYLEIEQNIGDRG